MGIDGAPVHADWPNREQEGKEECAYLEVERLLTE